jgi:hypothetical protein|tara:strand:- start:73 stop:606 length:534 start_codon:yes stop_codon:yes gene_type:complete
MKKTSLMNSLLRLNILMMLLLSACYTVKPLNEKISLDVANLIPKEQALPLVIETLKVTPAIPSSRGFDWGWVIKGYWGDGKNEDITNKGLKLFTRNTKAPFAIMLQGEEWAFEEFYNYENVYISCATVNDEPLISIHSSPEGAKLNYVRIFYFKQVDEVLKTCSALIALGAELDDVL